MKKGNGAIITAAAILEAETRLKEALEIQEAARQRVRAAEEAVILKRNCILCHSITRLEADIDAALQENKKAPQAAPRGKVEGVNALALGLRPLPGLLLLVGTFDFLDLPWISNVINFL